MKKVLDLDGQEFLDESISNANGLFDSAKDFFKDPKNAATFFLLGPAQALNRARKKEEDAKKALAAANSAEKDVMRVQLSQAQDLVAEAEAQLAASKNAPISNQDSSASREAETKTFPWKTVGFVGGGLVVATGLFFLVRHFVKKK